MEKHSIYFMVNTVAPDDLVTQRTSDAVTMVLPVKSTDIHIRAISQEMPHPSITQISLKITYLRFHSKFPGANELKSMQLDGTLPTRLLITVISTENHLIYVKPVSYPIAEWFIYVVPPFIGLTHKHLEFCKCLVSTMATNSFKFIISDQCHTKFFMYREQY